MTKQKLQTKTAISSNGMLAEVKPSAWVDIEKELPVTGLDEEYPHASEMILLSDGEFVYYGQYENSKEFGKSFIDANGDDFADGGVEITHWMPMPEPPSVGKV